MRRAGRLTAPYGAPFEVVHEDRIARLRHYASELPGEPAPLGGAPSNELADRDAHKIAAPLLLVPPLMVASEVYDIAPDVSAVAALTRMGVDVWLVDFGAPERERGGMERTLDDHVRAVAASIDRVRAATGRDVHVVGYSQGGMFAYQAVAFKRSKNVASVITMGSPVDLHRTLAVDEGVTERLIGAARTLLSRPLEKLDGLPGFLTSTGFKLLSVRKEAQQWVDFVKNLHDRQALEKREAKRLFLGGEGFVAWPGPAFRKFVDELIVSNRMQSGGFVIDGHSVSLADITCPILYFVGSRDEMGRPAAVRGIRRAAPKASAMHEIVVKAGHFGIVVGSTALTVTWPSVVAWMRWVGGEGALPSAITEPPAHRVAHDDDDDGHEVHGLELVKELAEKAMHVAVENLEELSEDIGSYLDNARYQLPRLNRLRSLQDDSLISFSRSLAEQAQKIGDRTFFLFRGRAFTYAESNRRIDAVVRGLIACGIRPGHKIGVMMSSRPSHLSLVCALNRLGAVAVLLSPETPDAVLPEALRLGEVETLICDPASAVRARPAVPGKLLVLGGVGEVPWQPGVPRTLPPGVIDMESIDPTTVTLPTWYKPDPGRARDLAMVFVSSGVHEPPRVTRITNRRWAFSALGAAAAATLTTSDTVYCCLPLHHPSGTLVAAGSALVSGARLALATTFAPTTFWDEVRRYGVSVVYYAGEMCRRLVDAPPVLGEATNPVRLFAGSGMRKDVWRRLDRFGTVGVLEIYASTEAATVLANARGKKIGSVGRPLPGSPDTVVAGWDFAAHDFERRDGTLVRARLDEPGMLIAKLSRAGADVSHVDPARLIRDAFEDGDQYFVTGEIATVDTEGDFWLVDRVSNMVETEHGPVASTRIEDAIYTAPGIALCIAGARGEPAKREWVAAITLRTLSYPDAQPAGLDVAALSAAIATLPEYARPHRVRIVDEIPLSDGFRPIKRALATMDFADGPAVLAWDPLTQTLTPTT
ncbi:MAG TPA: alpha/beta fold hydrolase [Kofleriaceae bacterium]|jgi:putative long chain acyl-CoA synthase